MPIVLSVNFSVADAERAGTVACRDMAADRALDAKLRGCKVEEEEALSAVSCVRHRQLGHGPAPGLESRD